MTFDFNLNTVLLFVVMLMQVWKVRMHHRSWKILEAQDKMVRENLRVQTLTNSAMLQVAKSSVAVGMSAEQGAERTLERVEKTVMAGVAASTDVAARLAEVVPPPGVFKTTGS